MIDFAAFSDAAGKLVGPAETRDVSSAFGVFGIEPTRMPDPAPLEETPIALMTLSQEELDMLPDLVLEIDPEYGGKIMLHEKSWELRGRDMKDI